MENNIVISMEQQFGEVVDIILQHKSRASKVVNEELLLTAWHVGGYVSAKLKAKNGEVRSCLSYQNIYVLSVPTLKDIAGEVSTTW